VFTFSGIPRFNENFERDKDTILLTFINHHNRKQNKCFIFTEFHYNSQLAGPNGSSWSNLITVWDIYENSKFGDFAVNHYTYYKPEIITHDEVITCEVSGRQCKTDAEFNNLIHSYMND
jgi:hypothetical protein